MLHDYVYSEQWKHGKLASHQSQPQHYKVVFKLVLRSKDAYSAAAALKRNFPFPRSFFYPHWFKAIKCRITISQADKSLQTFKSRSWELLCGTSHCFSIHHIKASLAEEEVVLTKCLPQNYSVHNTTGDLSPI